MRRQAEDASRSDWNLGLQFHAEPVCQSVHEREIGRDLNCVQHRLIRIAGCAHCSHVSKCDSGRRTCELAGVFEQRPQLWRQQIMVATDHGVGQRGILLDQTERRPVMFDSVVALVRP